MIAVLAANKQELENELRERVQAFFEANDEALESVSIEMKLIEPSEGSDLSTIHILVKEAFTGATV